MTVYLHSLGCDKNLVDSEIMLGLLYEAGYKAETDPSLATVIVVNTCGFIQEAVEEGIETILELAAYKQAGNCKSLIVTGCMAQRYKDEIMAEIPEADAILGVNDFPRIVSLINSQMAGSGDKGAESQYLDTLDDKLFAKRTNTMPLHVAYIKISEGCDNCCTYCTIPLIRGPYRDRKFESIVEECARLITSGAKELVLVAQDTARYGTDLYKRPRLHELLKSIAGLDGLGWVRVMYAYPEHIYPELIDTIAGHEKICSYLDMPIQHSHNDVIARMGRKSTTEDLRALIAGLQKAGIAIRTTLIAGFPGETEEEFSHLSRFVEEAGFDHLGVFAYSQEDKTPAAEMEPQIPAGLKNARRDKIMTLQAKIAEERCCKMVGQVLKVMVDGSVGDDIIEGRHHIAYSGRSERDAYEIDGNVFFSSVAEWMSGDFVNIKITTAQRYDVYGVII